MVNDEWPIFNALAGGGTALISWFFLIKQEEQTSGEIKNYARSTKSLSHHFTLALLTTSTPSGLPVYLTQTPTHRKGIAETGPTS